MSSSSIFFWFAVCFPACLSLCYNFFYFFGVYVCLHVLNTETVYDNNRISVKAKFFLLSRSSMEHSKKIITSNMQWDYELLDHEVHCNCRRQQRIWQQAPQHRTARQSKSHPQAARRSLYRFKVDWRKQTKTHWSHVTRDTQMDRVL